MYVFMSVQSYSYSLLLLLTKKFILLHRISRNTFEYVFSIIAPKLKRKVEGTIISPEKQFLIAIWRMATPDSYR